MPLKITRLENHYVPFKEFGIGEVFLYEDRLYVKYTNETNGLNCLRLDDEEFPTSFSSRMNMSNIYGHKIKGLKVEVLV